MPGPLFQKSRVHQFKLKSSHITRATMSVFPSATHLLTGPLIIAFCWRICDGFSSWFWFAFSQWPIILAHLYMFTCVIHLFSFWWSICFLNLLPICFKNWVVCPYYWIVRLKKMFWIQVDLVIDFKYFSDGNLSFQCLMPSLNSKHF